MRVDVPAAVSVEQLEDNPVRLQVVLTRQWCVGVDVACQLVQLVSIHLLLAVILSMLLFKIEVVLLGDIDLSALVNRADRSITCGLLAILVDFFGLCLALSAFYLLGFRGNLCGVLGV